MKLQSCKFHVFCECKLAENKIASIDRVRLRVRGLNEINKFSAFSKEISGRTPPLGGFLLAQYLFTTLLYEIVSGTGCRAGGGGRQRSMWAGGSAAAPAAAAAAAADRGEPGGGDGSGGSTTQ